MPDNGNSNNNGSGSRPDGPIPFEFDDVRRIYGVISHTAMILDNYLAELRAADPNGEENMEHIMIAHYCSLNLNFLVVYIRHFVEEEGATLE